MAEPDRVVAAAILLQHQFQVFFLQDTLVQHAELVAEHRRREALAPDLGVEQCRLLLQCRFRFAQNTGNHLLLC